MKYENLNYFSIDFETANQYSNSACSIGLVRFIDGVETDSVESLIHPAKMYFVPEWTRDIHHISYEHVKDKPYFPEVWETLIAPFIEKTPDLPFVAHNAGFDMNVIKGCCRYFNMKLPNIRYFDSLRISQRTWPELASHKLTFLGENFNIQYEAHDALEDSRTCGQLIKLAADKWEVNGVTDLCKKCDHMIKKLEE